MTIFPIHKVVYCSFLLLFCAGILNGGTSSKSIVASRAAMPPHIDGILNEDEWKLAVPVSGFQQFDPEEGAAPSEQTSVMVMYSDDALYVGVMCYDSEPEKIVEQLTRRDRTVQADRFSVIIDSYHDHSTAFLFSGTASGIQSDGVLSQDGRLYDVQWDAVWEFNAKKTGNGWSGEFKIPFTALRFSGQDSEYVWGINFRRYIARKSETDEWVMVPRKETPPGTISIVSKMGHLSGIRDIHPPLHLEILPYQVSKLNYIPQPSSFSTRSDFTGSVGLDLKYGVTNNFTFDVAINPDFGQVEVDKAVLNLTVFETQYPEKRPFFLEGAQLFSFGNTFDNQSLLMFYSRRIGKKPSLSFSPDPGFAFTQNPLTTTILGAAKISGRTDDGLTVGALTAVTDREESIEEDLSGNQRGPFLVEPRASYNVVRLKQDVLENSSVGMMATASFKEQNLPAVSGGVDWNLRFGDGTYAVDGYLAGSQVTTSASDRISGGAGRIGIGELQDEHWIALSMYDFSTRNFSINDIGFYSQPHEHGGYTQVSYKEDRAAFPVRRYALTLETDYHWDWDGVNTVKQLEFQPSWQFRNFWIFTLDYIYLFPAYDDINRGLLGLYRRPSGNRVTGILQTDAQKPVSSVLQSVYETSAKGSSSLSNTVSINLRPTTWIELAPGITWARVRNEEAWVIPVYITDTTISRNAFNLFGDRSIDQYNFSLRGTFTLSRTVSLQFFTQVLLAKGHYENFKRTITPDNLQPYNYPAYAGYYDPDFNEKTVNANLVLRWEYMPGSTFYFVWTQARYGDDGNFARTFSDNFADAFRLPMNNVFLAKINYWWNR